MRAFGDKANEFSHQQRLGYFLEKEIKVGSGSDSSIVIWLKKKRNSNERLVDSRSHAYLTKRLTYNLQEKRVVDELKETLRQSGQRDLQGREKY